MSTRRDRAAQAVADAIWLGLNEYNRDEAYRIADWVLAEVDRVPDISELIEASSLGTPGAKALRDSVSDERVQRVLDIADQVRGGERALDIANRVRAVKWGDKIIDPAEVEFVLDTQTDDGAVRSPATPRAVPHPAARAGVTGWRPAPSSPVLPRSFLLFRTRDITGMSGTGVVAWGVEFPDGTAALRWNTAHPSTVAWPSVDDIVAVHGHQGATVIRWLDTTIGGN